MDLKADLDKSLDNKFPYNKRKFNNRFIESNDSNKKQKPFPNICWKYLAGETCPGDCKTKSNHLLGHKKEYEALSKTDRDAVDAKYKQIKVNFHK